jgi:hypothetical protein
VGSDAKFHKDRFKHSRVDREDTDTDNTDSKVIS